MHGDITRSTFDPRRRRTSVRHQQGRALLDAEWNEQRDIDLHDTRTSRDDLLGGALVSFSDPDALGFTAVDGGEVVMRPGTVYIDGIRCEPDPDQVRADLPDEDGRYVVYVDAWERGVTALDDPSIREVALGGPDTTTRTELVPRVRFFRHDKIQSCEGAEEIWEQITQGTSGGLEVRVSEAPPPADRCLVPEEAGYTGLQNLLYRVEIHEESRSTGESWSEPTFKWAVDNASTVGRWGAPSGREIEVDQLGPGGTEGFPAGAWVELTTDDDDLDGRPGLLAEIDGRTSSTLTLVEQVDESGTTLGARLAALHDEAKHPRARRWAEGPAPTSTDWIPLDNGIEIRFSPEGAYRAGAYWTIPARTAILPGTVDRHIEWPVDDQGDPLVVAPHGTRHHHARLAVLERSDGQWSVLDDCRQRFTPLADQITFDMRGGDGQQAASRHWLPAPLEVGVSKGRFGVPGRRVRFTASEGGLLFDQEHPDVPEPEDSVGAKPAPSIIVRTDADGRAEAYWRLAPGPPPPLPGETWSPADGQSVRAELLDEHEQVAHLPLVFHAIPVDPLVLVAAGGDGQIGDPGETLEIALRARVSAGARPAPGQRVAFTVLTRMRDGVALDERTGGSLHASTGPVSTVPWPGGTRAFRVLAETDSAGVAQVQWQLGTDTGVPVQRVTADLLDAGGQPTTQSTLFTAHHGTAEEILWTPGSRLKNELEPGRTRHTVQEALDILARLVRTGGETEGSAPGEPWIVMAITEMGDISLSPRTALDVGQLSSLRFLWDTSLVMTAAPPGIERLAEQQAIEVRIRATSRRETFDEELVGTVGGNTFSDPASGELRRDVTWTATEQALNLARDMVSTGGGAAMVRGMIHPTLLSHQEPLLPSRAFGFILTA